MDRTRPWILAKSDPRAVLSSSKKKIGGEMEKLLVSTLQLSARHVRARGGPRGGARGGGGWQSGCPRGGREGSARGPRGGPGAEILRWVLVYVRAAAPGGASAGRYGRCVTYVTWLGPELCLVARGGEGCPQTRHPWSQLTHAPRGTRRG